MPPCGYIADGYTRVGRIEPCGFHPALVFEYRPMLSVDRSAFRHRISQLTPAGLAGIIAAENLAADEIARRLVSWTLIDHEGALVPIDTAHVLKVEPHLLASLAEIVLGVVPGTDARQERDEKN